MLAVSLSVLVTYAQNQAPKRGVQITPEPVQTISAGPYYALVIGNNNYQYPLNKLETAVNDATAVGNLLRERYGFRATRVLLNASRAQMLTALYGYRNTLPENSSFLIYYAGHGTKDPRTKKVYWLPVDAQDNNDLNWISASTIIEEISALRSAHVLVISDSCFSGDLTRDVGVPREINEPSQHSAYLRRMMGSPSRTLMSSGRDEPVADNGSGGHSKFAYALLKSLQLIDQDEFTAGYLFQNYIQTWVAGSSEQVPQYTIIPNSGHAFGDFVFSRGGKVELATSHSLPNIACATMPTAGGLGPKIRQGDTVPCSMLDQALTWLRDYELPKQPAQARWTARLTVTVDEDGHVSDIRPRGGTGLQGIDNWLKTAAQSWRTNPPAYKGMHVKSSFALDIDFGQ
jgi:TonB family protein